jgi:hypothetical protein
MVDVQTITVVITGISVIIGVILSINSRKQELETRQAQLFMQVYDHWSSRDAVRAYGLIRFKHQWKDLEDWIRQFMPSVNPEGYTDFMTHSVFFEGLGMLVKRNLIDVSMVEDLYSQRIIWYWEQHKPILLEGRKITNDPTQYDSMEYLYNIMKQRVQQATVTT